MTKIVFMGTPAFSVPILEGLRSWLWSGSSRDTAGSSRRSQKNHHSDPVKEAAVKHGLLVLQPENQWVTRNGADSSFSTWSADHGNFRPIFT